MDLAMVRNTLTGRSCLCSAAPPTLGFEFPPPRGPRSPSGRVLQGDFSATAPSHYRFLALISQTAPLMTQGNGMNYSAADEPSCSDAGVVPGRLPAWDGFCSFDLSGAAAAAARHPPRRQHTPGSFFFQLQPRFRHKPGCTVPEEPSQEAKVQLWWGREESQAQRGRKGSALLAPTHSEEKKL